MSEEQSKLAERLRAPFPVDDIEWRVARSQNINDKPKATVLAYVTARAVMDRLDEVFGVGEWQSSYEVLGEDRFLCTLACRVEGEWIPKTDGANASDVEPFKGGISDSLKRAAVHWGIGRYLYNLSETWVDIYGERPTGVPKEHCHYINDKRNNIRGHWVTPELPEWARPEGVGPRNFILPNTKNSGGYKSPTPPTSQPSGSAETPRASYPKGNFIYVLPYDKRHLKDNFGLKNRKNEAGEWEARGDEFHEELRDYCKNPPLQDAVPTKPAPLDDNTKQELESYGGYENPSESDDDIPF